MTIVPHDRLAPDTLRGLIEEFVTREGAVHGHADVPVERQVADVMRPLQAGQVAIVYDHETESCTICDRQSLSARRAPAQDDPRIVED